MVKKVYFLMLIIILSILFVYLIVFFEDNFSERAIKGQKNFTKLALIKLGMSKKQVVDIVGTPDKISKDEATLFYYDINHVDYLDGIVYFDSAMYVIKVWLPEE